MKFFKSGAQCPGPVSGPYLFQSFFLSESHHDLNFRIVFLDPLEVR